MKRKAASEATKKRTRNFEISYKALLPVQPTCFEAQRIFSGSSYFRIRCSMPVSDKILDALCFLQSLLHAVKIPFSSYLFLQIKRTVKIF